MMRFFNTAGPVKSEKHYCLPPLKRFDTDEILFLIEQEKYFVLHAPRQTGKTTCMLALMDHINTEGKYHCVYINVESAQGAREDVKRGISAIMREISTRARFCSQENSATKNWQHILEQNGEDGALNELLVRWCEESDKPVVLFIDEIDSLIGDTLLSVLRQLRSGYDRRPSLFPQSIILCGVRDIRDYRIHASKEKEVITGGSCFNIKSKSLRLGDFSKADIKNLYLSHTAETGQVFAGDVMDLVWQLTSGQPWLVNALGYETCFEIKENRDRSIPITTEMIHQAKENIILRRETHIDQLIDKLKEDRVRAVIEPVLAGMTNPELISTDDVSYVEDLGLIKIEGKIRIANDIYMEVIPRELTYSTQKTISHDSQWYIQDDGTLDIAKLLSAFTDFFRQHSQAWIEQFDYKEAGPQLLLQAFLQRIVNGGGRIFREYGLGRMRTDLLIEWPHAAGMQKIVLELKIKYGSLDKTIEEGLIQASKYMDTCDTSHGHLIIFDRTQSKTWDEKIFHHTRHVCEYDIHIWGI